LAAILDGTLTQVGDDPTVTPALIDHVLDRFGPGVGQVGQRPLSFMILVLDPVSIDLEDDDEVDDGVQYDLEDGIVVVEEDDVFVEVGGNVEVIVWPVEDPDVESFDLAVSDVPEKARAAVVYVTPDGETYESLTEQLRAGVTNFSLEFD
jgi:hypothetical protein